jgi:glycerol-3-phosphate acyltransferase PlsY
MSAAVALPIATALLARGQWTIFAFTVMVALLILVSHRSNLRRLLAGDEHRFVWRSRRDT